MSDLNLKYKTNLYSEWIRVNSFDKIPNNIVSIDCSNNNLINLSEVEKFTKLMVIDCSFNNLTHLPKFEKLTKLMAINCMHNKLTYLPEWTHMTNLNTICFYFNEVVIPPEWNNLINLKTIICNHNKLTYLPEWTYLINMESIICNHNRLTYLPEWTHMINLQEIDCSNNSLVNLPVSWGRLHDLRYYGNPIEYIPPNIQRIVNRQKTGQNIYDDSQNIHNHNIQICLKRSIEYLIKDKPSISIDQMKLEIENECISYELILTYCKDESVHSELNVTFEEVLLSVWCKIRDNINKQEIIKILNIEILDSECKFFTGRLTRLVNCMSGFDDNIKMEINHNEQMSNISKILYDKYQNEKDYQREFEERGYSEEDINIWSSIE